MTKTLIDSETYKLLANHASELSEKFGREITVDQVATAAVGLGLKDKRLMKKVFEQLGVKQKRRRVEYADWLWRPLDTLSFYSGISKRRIATNALLCYVENELQELVYDAERGKSNLNLEPGDIESLKKWSRELTEVLHEHEF